MVDHGATAVHRIQDPTVHIPAAVLDRDEPAAGFAEASGNKKLLPEASAVPLYGAGVLFFQVKRFGSISQNQVERLLLERVQPFHQTGLVGRSVELIEVLQQTSAIGNPFKRRSQTHVVLRIATAAEGSVGGPQKSRAVRADAVQPDVSRHARLGVIGTALVSGNRTDRRASGQSAVVDIPVVVAGHQPVRAAAVAAV